MPRSILRVTIICAIEEYEDQQLAAEICKELEQLVIIKILSIDEVVASLELNKYKRALLIPTPIFILSEVSTANDHRLKAVTDANPVLGNLVFRSYYICRGITPSKLLERHPELKKLADEAMIVGEEAKGQLLADIKEYVNSEVGPHLTIRGVLKTMFNISRYLIAAFAGLIGTIGNFLFLLGFISALVLVFLQVYGNASLLFDILVLICYTATGIALNKIETLELWPWLGQRWRPSHEKMDYDVKDSIISPAVLDIAISCFRRSRKWAAGYGIIVLLVLMGPSSYTVFLNGTPSLLYVLLAIMFGAITPLLNTWAYRIFTQFEASQRGLLETTLVRSDMHMAKFMVIPMPQTLSAIDPITVKLFDEQDLKQIMRWINVAALGSNTAIHRPWLQGRDMVFISYVWADESNTGVAEKISKTLDLIKTLNFLDKRNITSNFVGWRSHVAYELSKATHVLLIISESIMHGKVIAKEIHTIMQRWYYETLPAVICVVEPEVALMLKRDTSVPLALRFLLAWCPNISFSEAQDCEVLRNLIHQRRRNGRIKDWWVMLSGSIGEKNMIAKLKL
jgi:hypothetical protein